MENNCKRISNFTSPGYQALELFPLVHFVGLQGPQQQFIKIFYLYKGFFSISIYRACVLVYPGNSLPSVRAGISR